MKIIIFLAALLASVFSSAADPVNVEELWSHLFTNGPIVWQAPTNNLPKSFWIYKKLPRVFSATTISNAIILASFQDKGFPQPSTNQVVLWAGGFDGEPQPPNFAILPDVGQMSFALGDRRPDSPVGIATNQAAVERAWNCLARLGLDRSQFVKTNDASSGGYGLFIPRQIDGIQFYGGAEGFQIWFDKQKVLQFCLLFPRLERDRQSQVASPQAIIQCIKAHKAIVLPIPDEEDYFARLKKLATAKKLTITKITPYYGEGVFGEVPTNDTPCKFVTPIAELEAIANFGNSNDPVRLLSPHHHLGSEPVIGEIAGIYIAYRCAHSNGSEKIISVEYPGTKPNSLTGESVNTRSGSYPNRRKASARSSQEKTDTHRSSHLQLDARQQRLRFA